MTPRGTSSRQEAFESLKADYQAAKHSRFRRRRNVPVMGAGADFHYRLENDFLRIMEYARDMERNDAIAGPLVEQAVGNIVQGGLTPDPKTGDSGLDEAIKDRWEDWSGDARQCSTEGEMVYRDMEKMAMRRMFVDGDCFSILTDDSGAGGEGAIQMIEAHRCRRPQRTTQNCVHGVLLDDQRKRLEYWFTKEDIDPLGLVKLYSEITPVDAFATDENTGEVYRQVLHLRNPKRFTQTRGVSAFSPVFDLMGMHEDLNFAKLVQQQVASCIAILRNRDANWKAGAVDAYGRQYTQEENATRRLVEELAPGMELRGMPGETITGFSPNVPNAEFFQQMRGILQLIGINLGIPLVLLMMDASDTNFSGWRGAMDSARMGFRGMQQHLIDHWEKPSYLWKLRQWAARDRGMRAAMSKLVPAGGEDGSGRVTMVPRLYRHEWHAPRWPYIQPLQDAQADDFRQRKLLASPRRIHSTLASDFGDTVVETIDDNGTAIVKAIERAKKITKDTGVMVTWREVLFMTDPEMMQASVKSAEVSMPVKVTPDAQTSVREFSQKFVLALAGNTLTAALVANATTIAGKDGLVAMAGAPADEDGADPFLPVQVPAGQLVVTGGVVKDDDGDIVGGAAAASVETVGGADPAETGATEKTTTGDGTTTGGTTENTEGTETPNGESGAGGDKETGGQGDKETDATGKQNAQPAGDPEGNTDPEDDTVDPEDKTEGGA